MKEIYRYVLEVLGIILISAAYPIALDNRSPEWSIYLVLTIGILLYMVGRLNPTSPNRW